MYVCIGFVYRQTRYHRRLILRYAEHIAVANTVPRALNSSARLDEPFAVYAAMRDAVAGVTGSKDKGDTNLICTIIPPYRISLLREAFQKCSVF